MSAALDPTLQAALQGFAAGRDLLAAGPTVAVLAGGGINRTFRVRAPSIDWVVRLGGDSDAALAISRVGERQTHAAAAALGFAPAIIHADPDAGLLVTAFLHAEAPSRAQLRAPEMLRALGARLGELHRTPLPRTVRRLDVHDALLHYLEQQDVPPGPMSRADISARLRWSLASYRQSGLALCHNDLHHRNILVGERLIFVDWEYGGVGDPLFELAAIIGYHDLDEEQRAVLLAAHGGAFKPAHVAEMCLVFDCLYALWLDTACAWHTLEVGHREALLARLSIDPADREG
ncbi:MAG: phosphotransferase [Proteobacteria bacterium]|nr:phosphotransferase [Pseudomonadota bacterium]